jgi:ElaA protein
VVEQNCVYLDTDSLDYVSYHFCGYKNDQLQAYVRLLPPGISYDNASIGRVLSRKSARRTGIGIELMKKAILLCLKQFSVTVIDISAQVYLIKFYSNLGFSMLGETYLEDDIPHIKMRYVQ